VKADRAKLLESSTVVTNKLREELTENTRYYTGRLNEAGATIGIFKHKLAAAQAKNQGVAELGYDEVVLRASKITHI
jgi:hypothetical protein